LSRVGVLRGVLHLIDRALLEIGVVQQVKRLSNEPEAHPFVDFDFPSQVQVDVIHAGSAK
jgi:hypothetical protein